MKPTQNIKFGPYPTLYKGIGSIMVLRTITWNSPRTLENISVSKIPGFRIFGVYTFSDRNVNLCYMQRKATSTGLKTPIFNRRLSGFSRFSFCKKRMKVRMGVVAWYWQRKVELFIQICPIAPLLTTKSTWPGLRWNPSLYGDRQATSSMKCDTPQTKGFAPDYLKLQFIAPRKHTPSLLEISTI